MEADKLMKKQGYRFLGDHSALKICTWTKKAITNQGVCYKSQFYGIQSHLCAQITPTFNCTQQCIFCWRDHTLHNQISMDKLDDPKAILTNIPLAQKSLLSGVGGHTKVDKKLWKESDHPKHLAISLNGEPTLYPKLNELITEAHKLKYTTFVVTNGSQPETLKKITPPTQLYLSLDAPNEELFLTVNKPSKKDAWKDLLNSLKVLKNLKKKTRTAIRITCIKDINMIEPENYAKLIETASPHFVEVKAFMLLGGSRNRLMLSNMPRHHEVKAFAEEICQHSEYKIIDEHSKSRVCLLMKEDFQERIMKFNQ